MLAPTKDKGMVIIYWTGGILGTANRWSIYENGKLLTDMMRRGAFYSYLAAPGELRLATRQSLNWSSMVNLNWINSLSDKEQPTFRIEANHKYYLEMDSGSIKQVSAEEGEESIENCHWINPPSR